MSKFSCKCGNIINISGPVPNPNEWLVISDAEYDLLDESSTLNDLYSKMKSMLKCDQCNRLWIFWHGYDNPPTSFIPEV